MADDRTKPRPPSPLAADDAPPRGLLGTLVRLGVTPNMVSYAGFAFAAAAAICLALGAGNTLPFESAPVATGSSWWPLAAGVFWGFSAIFDLLDGRLARRGNMQTAFGAVLDSTLDRFGDMAVFAGCAVYYASTGNATYVLVSCIAAAAATQVSYVKARGENLVAGLGVGFWQRGERMVALLVGLMTGRVPTALWISAIFPLFTVLRRIRLARALLETGADAGAASRSADAAGRWAPWRQRRSSLAYQAFCVFVALAIVAGPSLHPFFYGIDDPLGTLLRTIVAPGIGPR